MFAVLFALRYGVRVLRSSHHEHREFKRSVRWVREVAVRREHYGMPVIDHKQDHGMKDELECGADYWRLVFALLEEPPLPKPCPKCGFSGPTTEPCCEEEAC
jgi:hypothetical protein